MAWNDSEKYVREPITIRVAHETKGGGEVALPNQIEFGWDQFVLSVTRTRTMQAQVEGLTLEERSEYIQSYGPRVAYAINVFVDKATQEFSFARGLYVLPDDERPSFAGNVGAAVSDLVMEMLGFHWRSNAAELKLGAADDATGKKKLKIPDYVYDPGNQHGFEQGAVVIVEAKGSLSEEEAKVAAIKRRASKAFRQQIKQFIDTEPLGLKIASGFALAFGAIPGTQTSSLVIACPQSVLVKPRSKRQFVSLSAAAVGGSLFGQPVPQQLPQPKEEQQQHDIEHTQHIYEQPWPRQIRRRGGGGGRDGGGERRREGERAQPSGRIAYANYENVFLMLGAMNAASFLRSILSGSSEGDEVVDDERRLQHFTLVDGRIPVLIARDRNFGIYEPSATAILQSAARNRLSPPPTIELPIAPHGDGAGPRIVMQGDGFALVDQFRLKWGKTWDLHKGDWV
jgi:hypothetical protein